MSRRQSIWRGGFVLLVVACGGPAAGEGGEDAGAGAGGTGASTGEGGAAGGTAGVGDVGGSPALDAGADAPAPGDAGGCEGARFATGVVEHAFGSGQDFGRGPGEFPDRVLGPPRGGGCCGGSLDVTSLGNGGFVVLEFEGSAIVDGPGDDFIVFENPFEFGSAGELWVELGTVSVSVDGEQWVEFPCTATAAPFGTCAGHEPVFANVDTNSIDPLDPNVAGGDAFDLADVGIGEARFVRITDRADLDGIQGAFDLDAVAIVHARCE